MGIFNKAIPKYTANMIDNSLVVEPTIEEPVTFVNDVYDPILNKAVRERLMSTYGNPIGATLGGYYELINNAFMGNKKQGGTMLPGIGVLSSFGRSMDKTGDVILGTLTETTKGLTGQGVESPLYNIFTEDEDYSGQRYLAAAANSMAKLANAPTLTEDDFGGVWTIPALGIDLATDPSILGGNLTKLAKGQGAVAEAGEFLKAYDDVTAKFAIDATAPGFRQAVLKFRKLFDNKVGFSSQEQLRNYDFKYNQNVNTVIKARQVMNNVQKYHPDDVTKATKIWDGAPDDVKEYIDTLEAVKTILDDNSPPEVVAQAIEKVQGTPESARKAIFDKFRDVDWKRKQFTLSDPNSFEQIPLDIQNVPIPNEDYVLKAGNVDVSNYVSNPTGYEQLSILDILKYGEDKIVTPKTGRRYVPIEMTTTNFRPSEIEDFDTYATSQSFINDRALNTMRKKSFKERIAKRNAQLYGENTPENVAKIKDLTERRNFLNTILADEYPDVQKQLLDKKQAIEESITKLQLDSKEYQSVHTLLGEAESQQNFYEEFSDKFAKNKSLNFDDEVRLDHILANRNLSTKGTVKSKIERLKLPPKRLSALRTRLNQILLGSNEYMNLNAQRLLVDSELENFTPSPERQQLLQAIADLTTEIKTLSKSNNTIDDIVRRHGGSGYYDEIIYTPVLKPSEFSEKFGFDPAYYYVTAEINGELKHLDYQSWESTVDTLQNELTKLNPNTEEYANKIAELNSWLKAIDEEGTAVYGFTKESSRTKSGKLANLKQSRYNTLDPKTANLAVQISQSELKPFINKWQQLGLIPKFSSEHDVLKWINSDPNIRAISQGNSNFKDILTVLFLNPKKKTVNSVEYLKALESFYKDILSLRRFDDKWYSDILSNTVTPELIDAYKAYSKTGLPIGEVNRRVLDMYTSTYPKNITDYTNIRKLEKQRQPVHYEFKNLFERGAYEKMYEDLELMAKEYFDEIANPIDRVIDDGLSIVDTTRASAYSIKESADWDKLKGKGHIKVLADESGLIRETLPEGTSGRFLYKNDINTDRYAARVDKPYDYQRTFNNVLEKYMSSLSEWKTLKAQGSEIPKALETDLKQLTEDLNWFAQRYSFKSDIPEVKNLLNTFRKKHVKFKQFDELDSSYNIGAVFNNTPSDSTFKQFVYKKTKSAKDSVSIDYVPKADSFEFIVGDPSTYAYVGGKYTDVSKLRSYADLSALNIDRSYWKIAQSQEEVLKMYRKNFKTKYKTDPKFKQAFDTLLDMYNKTGEVHIVSEMGDKGHAAIVKEFLESAIKKQVKETPTEKLVDKVGEFKIPSPPVTMATIKEYHSERNKIFTRRINVVKDSYVNLDSDVIVKKAFKPDDIVDAKAINVIESVIPETRGYVSDPEMSKMFDDFLSQDKNTLFKYLSNMSSIALHNAAERKTMSLEVENARKIMEEIDALTDTPGNSIRASKFVKEYTDYVDRTVGDVLKGDNIVNEAVFAKHLDYIKKKSDFAPGELNKLRSVLTNTANVLNKELGSEIFKVYETGFGEYQFISLSFNNAPQAINRANWKKALNLKLNDIVFHNPEVLTESTDVDYLKIKDVMNKINSVVVDQGKFLGFNMPQTNYVKHVMNHNTHTAEFLAKIRKAAKMPDDNELDAIHYSIMKTGLFNDQVGSFFIDPNVRSLRGIASQYELDEIDVFETGLDRVAKSAMADGMFADNNFQTIWGVFKSGSFTLSNYVKTDKELVDLLDLYGSSGNASNLQLVRPKYNQAGRIIGFQRFDKFSQIARQVALNDPETVIMDNAVLSIYDGVLRRQKALDNKAFTWINQHLTLPFKLGCLMNPGFLLGNMGDAITKQAITMSSKYGTSPVEEIAKIYEAHRAVTNLNNEFDIIYQTYLTQLKNAGYEITPDMIPELLTKDKKATEQFVKYLHGTLPKPNVVYSTKPEDMVATLLTPQQKETADVYLFMKSIQGGSFIDVDIKDSARLAKESFRPKYYKKSLWDRVTMGSGEYKWYNPLTWGAFKENPVSNALLGSSEKFEGFTREAMIYNDLMHSGLDVDSMRQYVKAPKGTEEYEKLRIGILNAMNTMHSANFDYANITDEMDFASKFIPFPTFYLKNLAYWLNLFVDNPQYVDTVLDIQEGLWQNEDIENDEFKAQAKGRGAIPLSAVTEPRGQKLSKFFKGIYKPSPFQSLYSAASALNNPLETTIQRTHPLIQGALTGAGHLTNLTTLQDPEDIRYRPYNIDQYQPNIKSTDEEFNPLAYTAHKANPLDRTINTALRTPGKVKRGNAQLSDFLPSIFQPDFSKK